MQAVHSYGPHYRTPLIQVRESLMVLRSLLHDGEVDLVSGTEAEVVTGLVALLLDRGGWLYRALRSVFFTPMVLSFKEGIALMNGTSAMTALPHRR